MLFASTFWKRAAAVVLFSCPSLANGQLIREERRVVIGGRPEVWRLEWREPPKPACGPDDPDWWTCPCSGFVFGEGGTLDLVRLRENREVERFPLTPLFCVDVDCPADDSGGRSCGAGTSKKATGHTWTVRVPFPAFAIAHWRE